MRGIAMAVIFFAWIYEYHVAPSQGIALIIAIWFVATIIIIAFGW